MKLPAFCKIARKEMRFTLLFVLFFFLIQFANYATRAYTDKFLVETLHAKSCSSLINLFTPTEKTHVIGKALRSGDTGILIDNGCDGIDGFILFIAAILAFPSRAREKALGIMVGLIVIYIFNIARIIFLYYILKYHQGAFDFFHVYVGQTFMVIIGLLLFINWALMCATHEKKAV